MTGVQTCALPILRVVGNDTIFSGFQQIGVQVLNSEKDPFTNLFNAAVDDQGIHGDLLPSVFNITTGQVLTNFPMCERVFTGVTTPAFPRGDLSARCTRNNGFVDSEDLSGDNRPDVSLGIVQEDVVRHVVRLGDPSIKRRTSHRPARLRWAVRARAPWITPPSR